MELELSPEVHARIVEISAQGDALAKAWNWEDAISKYNDAWEIIPEPKINWEASTWVLAAIADACFLAGYFQSGLDALRYAMACPGGVGNPFLHLRLGQCALEKNHMDEAAEHLARAYMSGGREILETDDAKYFEFLKTRILPPASGQW